MKLATTRLLASLLIADVAICLELSSRLSVSRRHALAATGWWTILPLLPEPPCFAAEDEATRASTTSGVPTFSYETRDRKGNKQAVIREDYWYMMGRTPPRRLDAPLRGDDPQWNAFGSCSSSESGGNSCTYVSLKQRAPAYTKYAFPIADGAKEYRKLGQVLRSIASSPSETMWQEAAEYFLVEEGTPPPPILDAELKMVLLATALLTSPNFPGPGKELLVARFYANECHFAAQEMAAAIAAQDSTRALQAWEFGKDSWNSYFQVVNRSIVPKVGEKFLAIE